MFLPKTSKRLAILFLLSIFVFNSCTSFFVSSSLAQETPQNQASSTDQQYKITPIPPSSPGSKIVPIPTSSAGLKIQEANWFGDFIGGTIGAIGSLVGDIGSFLQGALEKIVEGGMYVVEHTFIKQLLGDGMDSFLDLGAICHPATMKQVFDNIASDPTSWRNYGVVGFAGATAGSLLKYPVPVNSKQYFASINPFKSARAETGMETLQNNQVILEVWTNVRNASLALAVVALVIIGFMIMFRFPLGPRNVVTIQNALPKIAISLILIVFSYAIAGLMIDLVRIFGSLLNSLVSFNPHTMENNLIPYLVANTFGWVSMFLLCGASGTVAAIMVPVMLLLMLLYAIILLIVYIVIIFKLLSRYVTFLLLTMFAPLFFLFGAIPGGTVAYSFWFKRTAAALLTIPIIGFIFKLSLVVLVTGSGAFAFPDVQIGPASPFLSWILVPQVIAIGLLLFAMKVPDIVDQAFNNVALGGRGGGRGGGFGAILGVPFGALGTAGTLSRGITGIQGLAASYAGSGGVTGAIGKGLLRVPGIGSSGLRRNAGMMTPTQEIAYDLSQEKRLGDQEIARKQAEREGTIRQMAADWQQARPGMSDAMARGRAEVMWRKGERARVAKTTGITPKPKNPRQPNIP